jgi:hypothetical protein
VLASEWVRVVVSACVVPLFFFSASLLILLAKLLDKVFTPDAILDRLFLVKYSRGRAYTIKFQKPCRAHIVLAARANPYLP